MLKFNFIGRKKGALGIRYEITAYANSYLDLYNDYEHISNCWYIDLDGLLKKVIK
jgi:hypothetical protein